MQTKRNEAERWGFKIEQHSQKESTSLSEREQTHRHTAELRMTHSVRKDMFSRTNTIRQWDSDGVMMQKDQEGSVVPNGRFLSYLLFRLK